MKLRLQGLQDHDGIRRYVHLGTGNYNARTARLYTDVGLFTANPSVGADAMPMTPGEFRTFVREEIGESAKVIKAAGIVVQ